MPRQRTSLVTVPGVLVTLAVAAGLLGAETVTSEGEREADAHFDSVPSEPTFSQHVAPILFRSCARCHRPEGPGPFSVLHYEEARAHASLIAEMTSERKMPPWLPEPGHHPFADDPSLADGEIELIRRWARTGAPRGAPEATPPPPPPPERWTLGQPDLVVSLPDSFPVPTTGTDVFRNFVLPVPVESRRWVEAVEMRPGNRELVHHAVLMVDRTESSRRLAAREPGPGFEGMHGGANAHLPEGFFVGWTPGKRPFREPEGMAWPVDGETDLVLQLHLRPSGRSERIRPRVGLHFADEPPRRRPVIVKLVNELLDIPPGDSAHVVEDEFPLPVAVEVLSLYPHAHYLGKSVVGYALLPDGRRDTLIEIEDWDFDWQDHFRFREPISLPAGSRLVMRWTFDNTAANLDNPHDPPERVFRGYRSTDEMAELFVQIVARDPSDEPILETWMATMGSRQTADEYVAHYRRVVASQPANAEARYKLGVALDAEGRSRPAIHHLREAIRLEPEWWEPMVLLAWIRTAGSEVGSASPGKALRWARRAVELTDRRVPVALDALAAAQAAAGHSERALATAREAVALAAEQGSDRLARDIARRAEGYRSHPPRIERP